MVGFALFGLEKGTRRAKIFRLMIHATCQGRGYGAAAMEALLRAIEERWHPPAVYISYNDDNQAARRLYARFGFRELERAGQKVTACKAATAPPSTPSVTMRRSTQPTSAALYVFAGLPAAGKTTLARRLARELGAVYVRVDSIEQAIRDAAFRSVGPEGYFAAYRVAADNLRLGSAVVADSVNALGVTRAAWRAVAEESGVPQVVVEVTCSDPLEHRARVESRASDIPGLRLPTWEEVQARDYESWRVARIMIDTAGQTPGQSFVSLMDQLRRIIPADGVGGRADVVAPGHGVDAVRADRTNPVKVTPD